MNYTLYKKIVVKFLNYCKFSIFLFPNLILKISIETNNIAFYHCYYNSERIGFFFSFLNKSSIYRLKQCTELTLIDTLKQKSRFILLYSLLSIFLNKRIVILFKLPCSFYRINFIKSVSFLYKSSIWQERELFDMFGLRSIGNNQMKKLLTDYGFKGYPMLKDFPVNGFYEIYFSSFLQKIKFLKINI